METLPAGSAWADEAPEPSETTVREATATAASDVEILVCMEVILHARRA